MKKIIATIVLFAYYSSLTAQINVPKINTETASGVLKDFVKPPAIKDIAGTSTGITDLLSSNSHYRVHKNQDLQMASAVFLPAKKTLPVWQAAILRVLLLNLIHCQKAFSDK